MNDKDIVLGIFTIINSSKYKAEYDKIYPFRAIIDRWMFNELCDIINVVKVALSRCEKCYFILNDIYSPVTKASISITCKELLYIIDNPILLDKIQFVLNDIEISTEKAFNHLNLNNHDFRNLSGINLNVINSSIFSRNRSINR